MFIGYYKGVNEPREFYSEKQDTLEFPMQVELDGMRYLLSYTIQMTSSKQEENLVKMAKTSGTKYNIKIK